MAKMLTGKGRPMSTTVGELGQYYKDTTNGDIWECRIASEWSPLHGAPIPGYRWELRATGEDVKDYKDLYDGMVYPITINHMSGQLICKHKYADIDALLPNQIGRIRATYLYAPTTGDEMAVTALSSIAIQQVTDFATMGSSIRFVFMEDDGRLLKIQLNSDDTVERIA